MLLRPRKNEGGRMPEGDSLNATDAFDHPIPGQSLTEEPGSRAYEKPPQIVDVDEAVAYVVNKVETSNGGKEELLKQMMGGMPIESIVNTIAFAGFTDGQWTPDVAEMIKLPISAYFMMMAQEENIPAIMFNKGPSEDQGMSDDAVMLHMKENNPKAFAHLQQQAAMPPVDERQMVPEGFLAMPPDGEIMELEEQPVIEGEGMI